MSNACAQVKCNNFSQYPPREALLRLYDCYKYSMEENPEWREIPGFSNYIVSSHGQIKSLKSYGGKPRMLVPTLRFNKYFYVTLLSEEGKRIGVPVDRIVALAFIDDTIQKYIRIQHIDNIKYNNNLDNLKV
jgi:hypothetical protein